MIYFFKALSKILLYLENKLKYFDLFLKGYANIFGIANHQNFRPPVDGINERDVTHVIFGTTKVVI